MDDSTREDSTEETAELLGAVYKGAKMGIEALMAMYPRIEDNDLHDMANRHRAGYIAIASRAQQLMSELGMLPPDTCRIEKFSLRTGMHLHTVIRRDVAKGAQMIINGNTMGLIEMGTLLSEYPEASQASRNLTEQFAHMLHANIWDAKN